MQYEDSKKLKRVDMPHNIILEGRTSLSVSGVEDVLGFDDRQIDANTSKGLLSVRGAELHIESLSIENGELTVTGEIDSLTYSVRDERGGGFFSKLFK